MRRLLTCLVLPLLAAAPAAAKAPAAKPAPYDPAAETVGPLRLGMTAAAVEAALGAPDARTTPEEWGADGLWHADWTWARHGVTLGMAAPKAEGPFTVSLIAAKAPCAWRTGKGLGIGSTRAAVLKAWPRRTWDRHASGRDRIVVGSVFGGLALALKDGKVAELAVGAFAE